MSVVKGDNSAILIQKHAHWDNSSGESYTEIYSGPEAAAMAKYSSLLGLAAEVDCSKAGDGARFETVVKWDRNPNSGTPTADDSVNTDELLTSEESQSILQSPKLQTLVPTSVISVVVAQHRKVTEGETTYTEATAAVTVAALAVTPAVPGLQGNALGLLDDLILGRSNYYTKSHIYRRTYTVGRLSAVVAAFANENLIHTNAQMRSAEGTPNAFPLPDGEWRKGGVSVVASLRQKTQITYTYEWAVSWGSRYYDYVT